MIYLDIHFDSIFLPSKVFFLKAIYLGIKKFQNPQKALKNYNLYFFFLNLALTKRNCDITEIVSRSEAIKRHQSDLNLLKILKFCVEMKSVIYFYNSSKQKKNYAYFSF